MKDTADFEAGPWVDDGAPFSAIGKTELQLLCSRIPNEPFGMHEKPAELSQYGHLQYGSGSHASSKRRILGSVMLNANTDNANTTSIRHIVVEGASRWIIGRSLTRKWNP